MLNSISLIGNLGTDADLRYTPGGNPVTDFRMAVNLRWNNSAGEPQESVEWFTVVCWNRLAETVTQYTSKGDRVFVEGRLQTRQFTGNDGEERFVLEVVANRVVFLNTSGERQQSDEPDSEPEPEMTPAAARTAANKTSRSKANARK